MLCGELADQGFWDADASTVSVTGDGNYSLSLTYTGEDAEITDENCCLMLTLDFNIWNLSDNLDLAETGIVIDINSVDCDGTSLNYSGTSSNSKAYRVDDDGTTIRHNIFNVWSGPYQETEDIDLPFSVTNGSVVTVNFTISGLNEAIRQAKINTGEISADDEFIISSASTTSATTTTTVATTKDTTATTTEPIVTTIPATTTTTITTAEDVSTTATERNNNAINGVYGDVNGDSKVNAIDLLIVKKLILGITTD
jgi:hypothetical protein